ncbi:FAD-dependent oxidoreductase [Niallia sp. NCCP-28]|uniref:oxidoreductase n=1 Tax=Niallia sp. NCCP-28 TaxID=2934712 RepID=UPI00208B838A|nr:FAD-dependent oxidoreductase [Niallia sp. NCCP-28]GKU83264.1 2,4-dienoyl-CoA reductase [Niallia sp. NCCP-28]
MAKYRNIFTPITINRLTIKNRIVMPPMGTNFAEPSGEFNEDHIKYYEQRAKGGTGLIIVENACITYPQGSNGTTQIRIDHDKFIPGMYKLTERIHKHGAAAAIQINHAGASAVPERIGGQPVSSSNIPSKEGGAIPRPLNKKEIYQIAEDYGKAAKRAVMAGFDLIEIHAGHSYILCQFLSPVYNKRTDEFGGSYENRARFARLVIDCIRKEVGPFFPISLRFSAEDFVEGGNTLEDILNLLEYLQEGVDVLNVSAALNPTLQFQIDQMSLADGWRSYMSRAVKEKFNKPTITTGNIRNPEIAEEILERGDADFIGMGRQMIADPFYVEKLAKGTIDQIRKCISCNIGCAGHRIALNRPIRCTVNPDVIHNEEYKNKKIKKPVNVVVVGGGTAGLEAACTAAEVGCTTYLFEQKDYLGGLAREIARLPEKKRIEDLPDYLVKRAEKLNNLVTFINTKADIDGIDQLNPDVVINATGSKPLLPPIPGLKKHIDVEGEKVWSIFGLLNNINDFTEFEGKKVAVIGGGAVGLDVVEFFAERGAGVSIIEMQPELGKDLDIITKLSMMTMLKERNVDIYVNTALTEVTADHFKVKHKGKESQIEFDYGFVCLGMKPENPGLSALQEFYLHKDVEVVNIGDSWSTRKIMDGMREGRNILTTLEKIGAM